MLKRDWLGFCTQGTIKDVSIVYELASQIDNGIDLSKAFELSKSANSVSRVMYGATAVTAVPAFLISKTVTAVTTGTDVFVDWRVGKALNQGGALGTMQGMASRMAKAFPRLRGRLIFRRCECSKILWMTFTKWQDRQLGPTEWMKLEGGVYTVDDPTGGDVEVFSMDEARRAIDVKLRELLKQAKLHRKTSGK